MLDIIQLLPDSIANQIAAGEVVQRPASIVKELMENSIDAQSKSIKLLVKEAGKTLVQVIDDGIGMSETDARLSFERHATSKIRTSEDLFHIQTMGFRGEALASIAAVAQVEMKTKRATDDLGVMICIEASKIKSQESVSSPKGTSIAVKNVFFNVPARRNFLKSNSVEMRHIIDEFQRIALAHPEVEFSLFHNDLEIYQLPEGKLSQRIVSLFGKNYQKQLASCQEESPLLNIKGYIGKPEYAKKTRGEQFFFINYRYIRNAYLNHAVLTAYEKLIPTDAFPFYVLFLEIDPKHIDVNIHPTKTEIKFDDERLIYSIVQSAVRKALSVFHFTPALDFEVDANFQMNLKKETTFKENELYQGTGNSFRNYDKTQRERNNLSNWEKIYTDLQQKTPEQNPNFRKQKDNDDAFTFESAINPNPKTIFFGEEILNKERNTFQIHGKYLISQVKSGILLIEQKLAWERILYDKYLTNLRQKSGQSQQTLFPTTLQFNPTDFVLILEIEQEIRNLGFVFEVLANHQLLLKGVPAEVRDENGILEKFVEQIKNESANLQNNKNDTLAHLLAKRIAAKQMQFLSKIEMNALVDTLFASSNPNYTPDGKPIFVLLSLERLGEFFRE